jgi:hypothetical protein
MAVHEVLLDRYLGDGDLVVEVAWATWDLSVFSVGHGEATGVVAVPRPQLEQFLDDLWAGRLDERLKTDIRSRRVQRRRLASSDDATEVAVYGGVADPTRLTPRERDVLTGRIQPPGGPRGRDSKRRSDDSHRPPRARRFSPRVLVGAAIVAGVVVAGSALALSGGGDEAPVVATGPTTTAPFIDRPTRSPQLSYQVTVTVTSFETDEFTEHPPDTFSVGWFCGSYRVMDDGSTYPQCSPDPRDAWAYFAPSFELPDPIRRSFHSERALPTCVPGSDEDYGAGMILDITGYGSDTISGTYEAGHEFVECPLAASGDPDESGYTIGYRLTGTFTGRLVDELEPVTTTTTTTAPFELQPAPAPPIVNGSAGT